MRISTLTGISSFLVWSFAASAQALTTIDQAWLNARTSPYYLDIANETYQLTVDVNTPGTAFAIINNNITFDLMGHTITYDSDSPIAISNASFELGSGAGATNWAMGGGERYQGILLQNQIYDGAYSLRFDLANGNQTANNNQIITLLPNVTYVLTAMLSDSGEVERFVELNGVNNPNRHIVARTNWTYRGIQYSKATFTTGPTAETYTLSAGIRNVGANHSVYAYIDDIKIQRQSIYGITVGAFSGSSYYPDVTRYGNAANAVIRNGTIIQGPGGADLAHGIYNNSQRGSQVSNMVVTVHGADTGNFNSIWTQNINLGYNVFNNNSNTISSRDSFAGHVISFFGAATNNEIHNNTINGGIQTGIVHSRGSAHIHNNTITLNSKYTNDFAIMLWDDRQSDIHDNNILCGSGNNSCRGIQAGGGEQGSNGTGTKIYRNYIEVQELRRNLEYGGCELGGAYGIQDEGLSNVEIFNNTIKAVARECPAHAYRDNGGPDALNVSVHDNVLIAERIGSGPIASTIKIALKNDPAEFLFYNNVLQTNSKWIADTHSISAFHLYGNRFELLPNIQNPFNPLENYNWQRDLPHAINGLRFVDNVYADQNTHDLFTNTSIVNYWGGQIDPLSSYQHSFTTIFRIIDAGNNPVPGASMAIDDNTGNPVFSGLTNAQGEVQMILDEYFNQGGTFANYNPYSMTATDAPRIVTHNPVIDRTLLIICNIDTGVCTEQEVPPPGLPNTPPPPSNLAPTVNAGPDQTIVFPAVADLDGTVTDDGNPNPPGTATTLWTKVSGPGSVTFGDDTAIDTTASFSQAGIYVLRLTADDSALSASDDVQVTVVNSNGPNTNNPPFVNAGIDQTTTYPNSVFLDGLVTDDGLPNPPGQVTILWTKDTGPGNVNFVDESKEDTYAAFSVPGVYRLLLTADDGQEIRSDDVFITVNQPGGNGGGGGGSPGNFNSGKFINILSPSNPELFIPCNNPVSIYSRLGHLVAESDCVANFARWKGSTVDGEQAAAGVYVITEKETLNRKAVLLK